jgi:ribosomal protein L17
MADPLTILGAAAAASQLLQQGFQITSFICQLYSKVQDAPESIRKQVMQIEQLIDLARLIIQNPSLQTASVASILSTCMRSAAEVQGILKKVSTTTKDGQLKKVRKALTAVMKEKEILALFNNLEREKGLLTLCMQEIDA